MQRRLTTILAADIAGFSRLVGADEEGALAMRRRQREEIIDPLLAAHGGRVANTAGDSILIEFPSAVEALRFALAGQAGIEAMNADIPEDSRMTYRVGVNVGDVVAEGEDLLGDGVNIAARLEALAPPGGVVISRTARDQVRDRLPLELVDLGEIEVKNIARPVRAFQVVREGEARMAPPAKPRKSRAPLLVTAAITAALIGGGAFWWSSRPDFKPVDPATMALTLPKKPSVAVLPFRNLGAADADWIGDGLTENIISTLSISPDMLVVGRATSFAYKGKDVADRDVAQELGVRYILSGSVQSVGDKIRVTAELADAIEGRQIWSLREDSALDDIFEVQDRIAEKLFTEMQVSLTVGDMTRSVTALSNSFETTARVWRGRAEFQKFNYEGHKAAEAIWMELRRDDPESPLGPYLLGYIHWQRMLLGISTDPGADWAEAVRLAKEALAIRETGDPYSLLALLYAGAAQYDAAIEAADKGMALAPGSSDVHAIGGLAKYHSGQAKEGRDAMLKGMRLEPDYPEWVPGAVNPALIETGRHDEALAIAHSVLAADVRDVRAKPFAWADVVVANWMKGEEAAAKRAIADLLKAYPDATAAMATSRFRAYKPRPFVEDYAAALIAAGLPSGAN